MLDRSSINNTRSKRNKIYFPGDSNSGMGKNNPIYESVSQKFREEARNNNKCE